jgi:hypothetical protein
MMNLTDLNPLNPLNPDGTTQPESKLEPVRQVVADHPLAIVGALLLFAAAAASSAAYGVVAHGSVVALRASVEDLKGSVDQYTKRVGERDKALQEAHKEVADLTQSTQLQISGFKSSVEAFAKQAAACEEVKRQLHVSE